MDTNGKIALVTGGASGMGQIYARRLAANGAKVAIFDVNQQGLDATAAESDNITAFHCDIASLEDVNSKVAQVEEQLGPVDILVHAAALMPAFALAEHSHEGMEKLFRINYFGTTYMVRAVLPSMQARGTGRIIAFGSIAGIALVHANAKARGRGTGWLAGFYLLWLIFDPVKLLVVCLAIADSWLDFRRRWAKVESEHHQPPQERDDDRDL